MFEICAEFNVINDFIKNNFINISIENQKILFEFHAYLWNLNRIKKRYKQGFLDKIADTLMEYDIKEFMKDKNVSQKDKLKLNLLLKHKKIFYFMFNLKEILKF